MESKSHNCKRRFKEFSGKYRKQVDLFIRDFYEEKSLSSEEEYMADMYRLISEYCLREGKRIRPLLLLNSYLGYKRGIKKTDEIVKFAAVVELMHSFLLIQDDIIDRSEMRRGGKALHLILHDIYGNRTRNELIGSDIAIVLADVVFANCVEIIHTSRIKADVKNSFWGVFSKTYEKTAWGQILDSLNSMLKSIDPEDSSPWKIGLMKTAYYTMTYPMTMGYVLSGKSDPGELERIERFSIPLGVAFQVRDDVLGVFGAESETGKPCDSDISEGKYTLLVQETLKKLDKSGAHRFRKLLLKEKKSEKDVNAVRNTIEKSGALDSTILRHGELISESEKLLDHLSLSGNSKDVMSGVIEAVRDIPIL